MVCFPEGETMFDPVQIQILKSSISLFIKGLGRIRSIILKSQGQTVCCISTNKDLQTNSLAHRSVPPKKSSFFFGIRLKPFINRLMDDFKIWYLIPVQKNIWTFWPTSYMYEVTFSWIQPDVKFAYAYGTMVLLRNEPIFSIVKLLPIWLTNYSPHF